MSVGDIRQGIIAHQTVVDPNIELDFSVKSVSKTLEHHSKIKGSCISSPTKGKWDISRSPPHVETSKRWPQVTMDVRTAASNKIKLQELKVDHRLKL